MTRSQISIATSLILTAVFLVAPTSAKETRRGEEKRTCKACLKITAEDLLLYEASAALACAADRTSPGCRYTECIYQAAVFYSGGEEEKGKKYCKHCMEEAGGLCNHHFGKTGRVDLYFKTETEAYLAYAQLCYNYLEPGDTNKKCFRYTYPIDPKNPARIVDWLPMSEYTDLAYWRLFVTDNNGQNWESKGGWLEHGWKECSFNKKKDSGKRVRIYVYWDKDPPEWKIGLKSGSCTNHLKKVK